MQKDDLGSSRCARAWRGPGLRLSWLLLTACFIVVSTIITSALGGLLPVFFRPRAKRTFGPSTAIRFARGVSEATTIGLKALPIFGDDLVVDENDHGQFMLAERAKLVYCSIPKTACSQMNRMLARLLGLVGLRVALPQSGPDGRNVTEVGLDGRFYHELLEWPTLKSVGIQRAEDIMNDPSFNRLFVARDPVDRFVSGFIDKCWLPANKSELHNWNCPVQDDSRNNITAVFLALKGEADARGKRSLNPHFRPQSLFCDIRVFRDRFYIIPYSRLKENLVELAERSLTEREQVVFRTPAALKRDALEELQIAVAEGRAGAALFTKMLANDFPLSATEIQTLADQIALAAASPAAPSAAGTVAEIVVEAAKQLKPYSATYAEERLQEHVKDLDDGGQWLLDQLRNNLYREDYLFFGEGNF
jgi:Sulfotransferase family